MPFTPEEKAAWRAGQAEAKAIAKKRHGHEPKLLSRTPDPKTDADLILVGETEAYDIETHRRRASTGEIVVMVTRRKRRRD